MLAQFIAGPGIKAVGAGKLSSKWQDWADSISTYLDSLYLILFGIWYSKLCFFFCFIRKFPCGYFVFNDLIFGWIESDGRTLPSFTDFLLIFLWMFFSVNSTSLQRHCSNAWPITDFLIFDNSEECFLTSKCLLAWRRSPTSEIAPESSQNRRELSFIKPFPRHLWDMPFSQRSWGCCVIMTW